MGLQPPKPQLAAQSACLEECEGLLMVTPSTHCARSEITHCSLSLFFFFFFSHTNMLANKHVDPHECANAVLYVRGQKHTQTYIQGQSRSVYELWIIATPVL